MNDCGKLGKNVDIIFIVEIPFSGSNSNIFKLLGRSLGARVFKLASEGFKKKISNE